MTKKRTRSTSSSTDAATQYAVDVVEGRIVAGPYVRGSCQRHLNDLKRTDLFWDVAAVERVFAFFKEVLTLSQGKFEGKPFKLEPAQAFIVGSIFGWKRPDGYRRFNRAFVEQGKGNGKSPLAAGIGLYGMIADNEQRAEVYAAAATKDQAYVLYNDATAMRERSPSLSRAIDTSGKSPVWNMVHVRSSSFFRPISRETKKTGSGPRPHFVLCDEIHEHPDRGVLEMLEAGFKFRDNPLLFMITNSGSDRKSVCWEEHQHAVAVALGNRQDDTTFSYVCALDEGDDPFEDPSCWIKVNPLLGIILQPDYLARMVKRAKEIPGRANNIKRLNFCIWTDADTAWLSPGVWKKSEHDIDLEEYRGRECYGGLDLSFTNDLSAFALVFPWADRDDWYDVFVKFWKPKVGLKVAAERDSIDYQSLVDDGFLELTEGHVIKLAPIARHMQWASETFNLVGVAYDRYRHKELEANMFDQEGIILPMIEHPQGFRRGGVLKDRDGEQIKDRDGRPVENPLWMPTSVEETENALLEERVRFARNPLLRYHAASVAVRNDPSGVDNRVFDKRKAYGRIDGIVAAAMGIGLTKARKLINVDTSSVYEGRGLLIL